MTSNSKHSWKPKAWSFTSFRSIGHWPAERMSVVRKSSSFLVVPLPWIRLLLPLSWSALQIFITPVLGRLFHVVVSGFATCQLVSVPISTRVPKLPELLTQPHHDGPTFASLLPGHDLSRVQVLQVSVMLLQYVFTSLPLTSPSCLTNAVWHCDSDLEKNRSDSVAVVWNFPLSPVDCLSTCFDAVKCPELSRHTSVGMFKLVACSRVCYGSCGSMVFGNSQLVTVSICYSFATVLHSLIWTLIPVTWAVPVWVTWTAKADGESHNSVWAVILAFQWPALYDGVGLADSPRFWTNQPHWLVMRWYLSGYV